MDERLDALSGFILDGKLQDALQLSGTLIGQALDEKVKAILLEVQGTLQYELELLSASESSLKASISLAGLSWYDSFLPVSSHSEGQK